VASLSQAPYYAVYKSEAEDLAAFLAGVETLQDSGQPYCEFLDRGAWFIRLAMPVEREDCGTD
jgi:hypothetical protein